MAGNKKPRKRKKHRFGNTLPAIPVIPTYDSSGLNNLPPIINESGMDLKKSDHTALLRRLNFIDHFELQGLSCIKIKKPKEILTPSGEKTTGCYHHANSNRGAEIWLSRSLIENSRGFIRFMNWLSKKDRRFETLFHELGHHKASKLSTLGKFKNEAYAEKFMFGYRREWIKKTGPSNNVTAVFKLIFKSLKIILMGSIYFFRNSNPFLHLLYQQASGNIDSHEYNKKMNELLFDDEKLETTPEKKKWTHPLNIKRYRKKFKIEDR